MVPVVYGGADTASNLITLCAICHGNAPNEPAELYKWAASGLPPGMDLSKYLTKACISILFHREGLGKKVREAEELIDHIYPDIWKVFLTDPTDEDPFRIEGIKRFVSKYYPTSENGGLESGSGPTGAGTARRGLKKLEHQLFRR